MCMEVEGCFGVGYHCDMSTDGKHLADTAEVWVEVPCDTGGSAEASGKDDW